MRAAEKGMACGTGSVNRSTAASILAGMVIWGFNSLSIQRRAESQYGQAGRSGNRVKPLSGMPGGRRISYLAAGNVSLRGGDEYSLDRKSVV